MVPQRCGWSIVFTLNISQDPAHKSYVLPITKHPMKSIQTGPTSEWQTWSQSSQSSSSMYKQYLIAYCIMIVLAGLCCLDTALSFKIILVHLMVLIMLHRQRHAVRCQIVHAVSRNSMYAGVLSLSLQLQRPGSIRHSIL